MTDKEIRVNFGSVVRSDGIRSVTFEIEGHAGAAELTSTEMIVRGAFASHAGVRVLKRPSWSQGELSDDDFCFGVIRVTWPLYEEAERQPFCVGPSDHECSDPILGENDKGEIQIRLPEWCGQPIEDQLSNIGLTRSGAIRGAFVFKDPSITMDDAELLVEPFLAGGSRLTDQVLLLDQLCEAVWNHGVITDLVAEGALKKVLPPVRTK